ncbi:SIP domain-containing protein [Frigoribacterium sp. 2-23]|uniref:SIP domain-containing protein n=1 Tax=Frigoribacterium sp. 2-23 TaxID=3415006 RepID=UPI003C6ED66E
MLLDYPNPPLQHDATRVLFAGDASSLATMQALLSSLPICARGQVFVEVESADDIVPLVSPGRVTVTWLARDRRSGAPGSGRLCTPGVALERAVRAWLAEMYLEPADLATGEHVVWIGGPMSFAYDLRHDLRSLLSTDAAHPVA